MSTDGWELVVEEVFTITGRGTAVFGTLRGQPEASGSTANLVVGDEVHRIERVSIELARSQGADRQVLLLHGTSVEDVPIGSRVIGPVE
jgi:translation elongation factor EF-Tu-like GTPase